MYYRRKVLLSIAQRFGGRVPSLNFQKLLFLFCQRQEQPSFEFVPYLFGCFSFQSYSDIRALTKTGYLEEEENGWSVSRDDNYPSMLTPRDQAVLDWLYQQFRDKTTGELITHVYTTFPYFAINSKVLDKYLSAKQRQHVASLKCNVKTRHLFTIGYEGKSIDAYIDQLVRNGVKALCDVRRNPLSMKYGFSKNQLRTTMEKMGIKYYHFPRLGIDSAQRTDLKTQEDYDALFAMYEATTLRQQQYTLQELREVLRTEKRIALTCFEAEPRKCHRTRVARALLRRTQGSLPLTQL